MEKKASVSLLVGIIIAVTSVNYSAHAAAVVNGTSCPKSGIFTIAKVKGVSKSYVCTTNPSPTGAKGLTWTLKTCVSYWAAAKNSQDSINEQRSLVSAMSEPDKTTYTKQLDGSQGSLNKVFAAISANHCRTGL